MLTSTARGQMFRFRNIDTDFSPHSDNGHRIRPEKRRAALAPEAPDSGVPGESISSLQLARDTSARLTNRVGRVEQAESLRRTTAPVHPSAPQPRRPSRGSDTRRLLRATFRGGRKRPGLSLPQSQRSRGVGNTPLPKRLPQFH